MLRVVTPTAVTGHSYAELYELAPLQMEHMLGCYTLRLASLLRLEDRTGLREDSVGGDNIADVVPAMVKDNASFHMAL